MDLCEPPIILFKCSRGPLGKSECRTLEPIGGLGRGASSWLETWLVQGPVGIFFFFLLQNNKSQYSGLQMTGQKRLIRDLNPTTTKTDDPMSLCASHLTEFTWRTEPCQKLGSVIQSVQEKDASDETVQKQFLERWAQQWPCYRVRRRPTTCFTLPSLLLLNDA